MRSLALLVAGGIACCALPLVATAESLTPIRFRQVLATAKAYAADRTLIFYCIRNDADLVDSNYLVIHVEIQDALNKLKAAGSDPKQNAQLVQAVVANVRYPTAGVNDAAMDAECKAKNVEESYYTYSGPLVTPLGKRPPFDSLK